MMKKSILIQKRKEAHRLKRKNWSIRKIAGHLVCSPVSVVRWLKMDKDRIEKDARGWQKGRKRKYGDAEKERLIALKEELEKSKAKTISAKKFKHEYRQRFGSEVSEWFIQRTLRDVNEREKEPEKEISSEDYTAKVDKKLQKYGKVIMELNFWVTEYGKGKKRGINFISCKYVYPFQLGIFYQISEFTCHEVKKILKSIMARYVRPDILKMSYHPVFGVNLPQKGFLGNLAFFLLNLGINPFYSIPRNIRDHAEVDWFKRTFSDTFFTHLHFGHKQVKELEVQNYYMEYRSKSDTLRDITTKNPYFINAFTEEDLKNRHVDHLLTNHVFFLQIAELKKEGGKIWGRISVLGVEIVLDAGIIHLPVLCKLDLRAKSLLIYSIHRDGTFKRQKKMNFVVQNVEYR